MRPIQILFLAALLLPLNTFAQIGADDPTFNPTDLGYAQGESTNGNIFTAALQNDGKVIIGGLFTTFNGVSREHVARLNADGTLDASFNIGTGANSSVFALAIQSDGKIVIGGYFTSYNGTARNHLARLNADGSLDETFTIGTGPDESVQSISIQSDGKIIIGGYFTAYNGTPANNIARLNANGSLDATFIMGTGANNEVTTTEIQGDGKIIIGGSFSSYNGTTRNRIARLNTDGTIDGTFTLGTGANNDVVDVALQSDGKIIIGGWFTSYNGTSRNRIARLNANGTLDTSFDVGTGANDLINDVAVQPDGKVIIGGIFSTYKGVTTNLLTRLNTDGSLDATFNMGTGVSGDEVQPILMQADGKIIISGLFSSYNGVFRANLARVNANGSLDATFNFSTGVMGLVQTAVIQNDGKIIISGYMESYNDKTATSIARLNTDGSHDATFAAGTGSSDGVFTTVLQSDGKILIGGDFDNYNGTARNRIARLNANGTLDATFNVGTGANGNVIAIVVQSDGKVIIGGGFTTYNGVARKGIARLNADGSLDATFAVGTGVNVAVLSAALQSDGKIIIGGNFTTYNATARNAVARLNTDGSLDATFVVGAGANSDVLVTRVQADGKIIIAGDFTSYKGTAVAHITRLNSDGSLDASFNIGTGANDGVQTVSLQSDGRIIIGGDFTSYNGVSMNRLARLNTDGSLDATFTVGTGFNDSVLASAVQTDGSIIVGGFFTSYNGKGRNRITRIMVSPCTNPTVPTINATSSVICEVKNITLTITSGMLNSASNWQWLSGACDGGSAAAIGSGTSIVVSPTTTTTYYVKGQGGCVTTSSCGAVTITVATPPDATTTLNGIQIKANQSGASYEWFDCNNGNAPIANATNQVYEATTSGTYAVNVTRNGCTSTSACVNVIVTATEKELAGNNTLRVYPNPSSDVFTVQSVGKRGVYIIKNELGQTVKKFLLGDDNDFTVRVQSLSQGVYMIIGGDGKNITYQKVLITR